MEHPQRAGDPLAITVNYCAPIAEGDFDLDLRLVKANRSSQHWSVELSQGGAEPAAFATAVLAERRPSWSQQQVKMPDTRPFEQIRRYPDIPVSWTRQYDFRFIEGMVDMRGGGRPQPGSAFSKLWIGDRVPRAIDAPSLLAMSDAFFARIFHVKGEVVPIGTVLLTTYFHADTDDLARQNISHVLGVADAKIFHKSYGDQSAELWSPSGRLLATTTQMTYFKA